MALKTGIHTGLSSALIAHLCRKDVVKLEQERLVFWGKNQSGAEILLGTPSRLELKKDRGAADILTVRFPAVAVWENLRTVRGYKGNKPVFSGICDEQTASCGSGGMEVEIVARSMAALLMDNEVMPQTLRNPSLSFLSRQFAEPLGLRVAGREQTATGELVVQKGTSVMGLFNDFGKRFLHKEPFVTAGGEIVFDPPGKKHRLTNLLEWSVTEKNCDVISEAWAKNALTGAYSLRFLNPNARGILRKRYVNGSHDFTAWRQVRASVPRFADVEIFDAVTLGAGISGIVRGVRVIGNQDGYTTVITAEEEIVPPQAEKGESHVDF